jgi:Fe2+ or Zn2+ uptake regulation protein
LWLKVSSLSQDLELLEQAIKQTNALLVVLDPLNASGIPSLHWLGENHTSVSTLLKSGTTLSLERQQILQVLRDADGPLGPQDLTDRTGQNYILVRQTLSRMHEAGAITRPSRGKYTTLDHPSLLQKSMHTETTVTSVTSVTNDTSDTSDTIPVSAGSFTDVCGRVTNDINNITFPSFFIAC